MAAERLISMSSHVQPSVWISAACPAIYCVRAPPRPPPDAPGSVIALVMPFTRTTPKCSLSGLTEESAAAAA